MRTLIIENIGCLSLLVFFILGFAYYMTATILMKGSIFEGMRGYIGRRALAGSRFFVLLREMLGCLMCTATEASLWTIGLASFSLGLYYGVPEILMGALLEAVGVLAPDEVLILPAGRGFLIMAAVSFALSLSVSGQAWAIKTIVEHREEKFLELRSEFRQKETQLLLRISQLERGTVCVNEKFEFDLS